MIRKYEVGGGSVIVVIVDVVSTFNLDQPCWSRRRGFLIYCTVDYLSLTKYLEVIGGLRWMG